MHKCQWQYVQSRARQLNIIEAIYVNLWSLADLEQVVDYVL